MNGCAGGSSYSLFKNAADFFAIPFPRQGGFHTALFAGWNVEGMPLHFADDVFLLHFALEPAERAFERLVIAEFDFCHCIFTSLSLRTLQIGFAH